MFCNIAEVFAQAKQAHQAGRLQNAEGLYRTVLAKRPDHPEALHMLGALLARTGRAGTGALLIAEALRLEPALPHGHYNLGAAWLAAGRPTMAEQACLKSISLDGPDAEAFLNLGNSLGNQGRAREALACYCKARKLAPTSAAAASASLMGRQYVPGQTEIRLRQAHEETGRAWLGAVRQAGMPKAWPRMEAGGMTLRVGFVSPDLRRHPVGFFLVSYLSGRTPGTSLATCYSDAGKGDELTRQIRNASDNWRETSLLGDAELKDLIIRDNIDILVDLAGYTRNNRFPLFASRAAPVQAAWAGYPGTTGLENMDYLITDRVQTPPGSEAYYSEALAILPDGYVSYAPPSYLPEVGPLPALASGRVTLGSCNSMPKINQKVLKLWAATACAIPNSRVLAANTQLGDKNVRRAVYQAFRSAGIAASRVELVGGGPHQAFLSIYKNVDISLDTFPYTGGLTTLESLVMGVPVVAMSGNTFAGRHSSSHLAVAGLSDWVARSAEEYISIAVKAVSDLGSLASLRASLRQRTLASPLCCGKRFARHLEAAFQTMWRQHAGRERRSFCIQGDTQAMGPETSSEMRIRVGA